MSKGRSVCLVHFGGYVAAVQGYLSRELAILHLGKQRLYVCNWVRFVCLRVFACVCVCVRVCEPMHVCACARVCV